MNRPSMVAAALLFLFTGTLHFVKADTFVQIVPPALPAKALLVAVSGVAELAGGIGLLIPQTRAAAVYGLIALLLAVFPANLYMAIDHEHFAAFSPAWVLYARLPVQLLLIAWIWGLRPARRA